MEIYIGLVVYILLLPMLTAPFCKTEDSHNRAITFWGILAIYLLLALKGDVGSDISEYKAQYMISASKAWTDIDYVYFEPGYITLMKLFSKAGVSFQGFMICVYTVACIALYQFIRKCSRDPMFSLIIFVCYQFFVFYNSGIRQMIAVTLCIFAYFACTQKRRWRIVLAALLQAAAISVHSSSIVFVAALVYTWTKSKTIDFFRQMLLLGCTIVMRPLVWRFVNANLRAVDTSTGITLGGSFLMLCGIALIMYIAHSDQNIFHIRLKEIALPWRLTQTNVYMTRMIFFAVFANILFSGGSLLRSAMYFTLFLIPGLPNTAYCLGYRNKYIFKFAFLVLFIALFYFDTLVPNQLEICPYVFFWE